jgi:hypothetical protein
VRENSAAVYVANLPYFWPLILQLLKKTPLKSVYDTTFNSGTRIMKETGNDGQMKFLAEEVPRSLSLGSPSDV